MCLQEPKPFLLKPRGMTLHLPVESLIKVSRENYPHSIPLSEINTVNQDKYWLNSRFTSAAFELLVKRLL